MYRGKILFANSNKKLWVFQKETLKKSTPEEKAVNKLFPAVLREKLQKNLIKSMPEKNLVLYASPGEKGRKKK